MGSSWDTAATHGGTSLSHDTEKWEVRKFESRVSKNLSEETWQLLCASQEELAPRRLSGKEDCHEFG